MTARGTVVVLLAAFIAVCLLFYPCAITTTEYLPSSVSVSIFLLKENIDRLLGTPIPPLCGQPNDRLPGSDKKNRVYLIDSFLQKTGNRPLSNTVTIGNDPSYAFAAVTSCNRKEVKWPESVIIWQNDFRLTVWLDLRNINGSRGHIRSIRLSDTGLLARRTYGEGSDFACYGTYSARGVTDVSAGGELELQSITVSHGEDLVCSALGVHADSSTLECRGDPLNDNVHTKRDSPAQKSSIAYWAKLKKAVVFGLNCKM